MPTGSGPAFTASGSDVRRGLRSYETTAPSAKDASGRVPMINFQGRRRANHVPTWARCR
jgi:hypothetical protein